MFRSFQRLNFNLLIIEQCGLNGALYFVEMSADGGLSEDNNNKAGSAYGTGYCDSQCPQCVGIVSNGLISILTTS